jgi:hypothetical protein
MSDYRNPKENEGHDGFIWSRRPAVFAVILTLALALASVAPALARGIGSFGW